MYNPGEEISSLDFGAIIGGSLNAVVEAQAQSANTTVNFIKAVGFKPGSTNDKGEVIGVGDPITVNFKYSKEVSPYVPGKTELKEIIVKESGKGYAKENIVGLIIKNEELEPGDYSISFTEGGGIEKVTLIKEIKASEGDVEVNVSEGATISDENKAKLTLVTRKAEGRPPVYQDMEMSVPILTMLPIPFIKIETADIDFNVKINSVYQTDTSDKFNSDVKNTTEAGWKGFGASVKTTMNASFSNQKSSSTSENVKKDYSLNIKLHATQDDMPLGVSRMLDILEESISMKPAAV